MLTKRLCCAAIGCAACVLFTLGCNGLHANRLASHSATGHDHGDHAHGGDPEIVKALASLSPADRALAQKQRICPVTDEPLGAMGAPMKVSVQGRDVFVCCAGCKDPLTNDPATYLAKLPN